MRVAALIILNFTVVPYLFGQKEMTGWELFNEVEFETKYSEDGQGLYYFPVFNDELKARDGEEVTLKGYFIPVDMDDNMLVISKYPYSSCFFCGGAGPESVAVVIPKEKFREYYMDEVITVRGRLKLNDSDIYQLNFILDEAEMIKKDE